MRHVPAICRPPHAEASQYILRPPSNFGSRRKRNYQVKLSNTITQRVLTTTSLLIGVSTLHAGSAVTSEVKPAEEESVFDKIWSLATIYKNADNPVIQELKLRGRYHGQYHWLDSQEGDHDGWENRRSRLGIDVKLFHQFELRLDAQSNDEFDPFYDRLVDAYIKWKPAKEFNLTLGKQKPQIGYYDFLQSTNNQPTFERSQIFNQLRVDRVLGGVIDGKIGNWSYQAGLYSNDIDREFGQIGGGWSVSAGIGYDFKDLVKLEKADFRVDWLHSEIDNDNTLLNRYENIGSATVWLKDGRWSFVAEAFLATGESPDAFGFFLQPTYDLIEKKLQLVGRYSFSTGNGPDSVTAQARYEREAPLLTDGGRGEEYHAGYLGFQYFIYGDKLKLMGGIEYAHLDGGGDGGDLDAITGLTGIRISF
jgi:phosphate-selective porin OprO and OprP